MADILAEYQNIEGTVKITVFDDISYEITRNGYTTKRDMSKWYVSGAGVVRHIRNDIKDGYYPDVYEVVLEAN